MILIHRLKDISLELFPDLKKYADDITTNTDSIKDAFTDYYTYGPGITIKAYIE